MNEQQFKTHWVSLQPKIKQKWSKFSDQDLKLINGQQDKFLAQLHQKYGINKDQALRELAEVGKTVVGAGASSGQKPNQSGHGPSATPSYSKIAGAPQSGGHIQQGPKGKK